MTKHRLRTGHNCSGRVMRLIVICHLTGCSDIFSESTCTRRIRQLASLLSDRMSRVFWINTVNPSTRSQQQNGAAERTLWRTIHAIRCILYESQLRESGCVYMYSIYNLPTSKRYPVSFSPEAYGGQPPDCSLLRLCKIFVSRTRHTANKFAPTSWQGLSGYHDTHHAQVPTETATTGNTYGVMSPLLRVQSLLQERLTCYYTDSEADTSDKKADSDSDVPMRQR
jgi:hypothetical protein